MEIKALLVEDDESIRELVSVALVDLGIALEFAVEGESGLARALAGDYGLIILDLMLPNLGGMEICRKIREVDRDTPILMLSAKGSELDRVLGLEVGADDYLTKPFGVPELLARVRVLLRRSERVKELLEQQQDSLNNDGEILDFGTLVIDIPKHKVERDGQTIALTQKEFDMLALMARRPGVVFDRDALLFGVWGHDMPAYVSNVNTSINRLRLKLEVDPGNPKFIKTVRGVGYCFAEPGSDES